MAWIFNGIWCFVYWSGTGRVCGLRFCLVGQVMIYQSKRTGSEDQSLQIEGYWVVFMGYVQNMGSYSNYLRMYVVP